MSADADAVLTIAPRPPRRHHRNGVLAAEHRSAQVDRHGAVPHVDVDVDHVAIVRPNTSSRARPRCYAACRSRPNTSTTGRPCHGRGLVADVDGEGDRGGPPRSVAAAASRSVDVGDRHPAAFGHHARRDAAGRGPDAAPVTMATRSVKTRHGGARLRQQERVHDRTRATRYRRSERRRGHRPPLPFARWWVAAAPSSQLSTRTRPPPTSTDARTRTAATDGSSRGSPNTASKRRLIAIHSAAVRPTPA